MAEAVVHVTIACDTRLARVLLDALAPLVLRGAMDESDLRRIVVRSIKTAVVQD